MTTVAYADDQLIMRDTVSDLIEVLEGYTLTCLARHGKELLEQIEEHGAPDIAILDLSMPVMDGQETAAWLIEHHPKTAVLIYTSHHSEGTLIPLIRLGIKGFLRKEDIGKAHLRAALNEVTTRGYYLGGDTGIRLFEFVHRSPGNNNFPLLLDEKEVEFIRLCCSELAYKEIADQMDLTPRAIDGMRDGVFEKLKVKSRATLVMFAMRNGLVLL